MKRAANTEPMSPEAFRRALEAIGWQQTDFAERTGMHPQTVNRWATGKAPAAPWATAYLEAMLDLAALRDKYLTPGRRLADLVGPPEAPAGSTESP